MTFGLQNLNERDHPSNNRNLIIFIILSLLLWTGYDMFILKPKMEAQRVAEAAREKALQSELQENPSYLPERPRLDVIESSPRIEIENGVIFGSINRKGARLDDIFLHDYYMEIEKLREVAVLSPSGSPHPKFIQSGWRSVDEDLILPDQDTLWDVEGGETLTPDTPVTLFWENGQGIRFEKTFRIDDKYLITLEQRLVNSRDGSVILSPYALISEHGLPEDYTGRFIVHEGPISYIDGELEERSYKKMKKEPRLSVKGSEGWIAITEKYWLAAILPDQNQDMTFRFSHSPAPHDQAKERNQVDLVGQPQAVKSGDDLAVTYRFFTGAKEVGVLNQYEKQLGIKHLDLAVDFGMFYFLTVPFFWVIHFFYNFVGNFGLAIIMMTIVLRIVVFPLANTSYKSFAKLRKVSPEMFELRQKYADDKQKLQEELVKLYQKEKVNPMAGCLPILIQIPIFFALFKVLSISIEMRHQPFFGWIQDLSAPDPTSLFNLFGLIPWSPPQFLIIGIWPCLMLLTMIVQRKMSPPPPDKMQAQMIAMMPYVMTFILAKFASGLVIYWTFSNLLSVIQQYIIMKNMGVEPHLFKKEGDIKEAEAKSEKEESAATVEKDAEQDITVDKTEPVITPPKPKKSKKKK